MAEKLLKFAAWNRLLIELKYWRPMQGESNMAKLDRPGIYSRSRVRQRTQTRKTAMARRVQIKSQITKGHLCAWLDNRMRLKQMTGRRRSHTAQIPAIVTIH